MAQLYKATGINLKAMPLGESDRLLTILTPEYGLIRVVAPGVRKQKSKLGGRSELFVVNQLLISKGRSLDRINQAETILSYAGLSQNLGKLAAGQYLAELVLHQALSEHPQTELFYLLSEHLGRIEQLQHKTDRLWHTQLIAYLAHGIYHLLAIEGIAPQVQMCCATGNELQPNFNYSDWQVGFSIDSGGIIKIDDTSVVQSSYPNLLGQKTTTKINTLLNANQLSLLQQLAEPQLKALVKLTSHQDWIVVEKLLRKYAQYHLGYSIRSAELIDTYLESQIGSRE
ncbi:DNA recombination protein RecO [Hydrocoleum sp. CS-953]|uniref:DNA repair protein RecO n=1 Tax=Hydrocoleum sp. CS-953 TaxID=1671698 RepID=UPI000B9B85F7|nr:DNA repair protein RecO [Hydrocoleum sp. CS-953]OZH52761.1 DNA recombination protein RecO [Hydrocoleum sp. CS-953]